MIIILLAVLVQRKFVGTTPYSVYSQAPGNCNTQNFFPPGNSNLHKHVPSYDQACEPNLFCNKKKH